jgi:hypothetical protein
VVSASLRPPTRAKQACVVLDDDEVLFNEDEPLQKQLR